MRMRSSKHSQLRQTKQRELTQVVFRHVGIDFGAGIGIGNSGREAMRQVPLRVNVEHRYRVLSATYLLMMAGQWI